MKKTAVLLAFLLMSVSNASAALTSKGYVDSAIKSLDANRVGADGSYIQYVSETDGVVSATAKAFDSSIIPSSTNAVQGQALYKALQAKQDKLAGVKPIMVTQKQVSISNATKDAVGVVKYGAIPTASDGTGEAFMWVE